PVVLKYNPATLPQVSSLTGKFTRVPDLGRTPRSKFNHRDRQGREDLAECESCRAILQFQSDEIATGQNLAQPGTLRQSRNWQKGLRPCIRADRISLAASRNAGGSNANSHNESAL